MVKNVLINKAPIPVVGPSHCVRFKHALETGQLPIAWQEFDFIGVGGMPIWSPRIDRELGKSIGRSDPFFIVGDFRFGNPILKSASGTISLPVAREFLAVDKDLISEENDKVMFDLSIAAARSIVSKIPNARLMFWDLTIREFENRSGGKYQEAGPYKHPVWNLDEVLDLFGDHAIDTRDMLSCAQRFYIDSSGHPSLLGWLYILQHIQGRSVVNVERLMAAFDRALDVALDSLFMGKRLVITGDSKFTRLLDKFVKLGIFRLPPGCTIVGLRNAVNTENVDACLYFPPLVTYPLNEGEIAAQVSEITKNRRKLESKFSAVSVLFYDNWAFECISKRKDYIGMYLSSHDAGRTVSLESQVCSENQGYRITESDNFEGIIELNNTLVPTTLGFIEILGRAASATSSKVHETYESMLATIEDSDS